MKFIFVTAVLLQQIHKGFHSKRIVLCGYAELPADRPGAEVSLFQQAGLFYDLPGVAEEFFSFCGKKNTLIGSVENGDAQFFFQIFYSSGQAGLGNEKLFGGFADGACAGDGYDIF